MVFVSLTYLLFLVIVFALHWVIRGRTARNVVLLVASYFFYAWWDWRFCSLMLVSSLVDFVVSLALDRTERISRRRLLLATSLVVNLGMLGFFKYAGFFADSFTELMQSLGVNAPSRTWSIVLPVGISFYTFQTMSYTIDVYRRQFKATRRIIDYMAYVSFFPQLVAGPIERAASLLPQFTRDRRFDLDLAREGLRMMLWGFAKKMILADNLGVIVDQVYRAPDNHTAPVLVLATFCFAFQVYCDFSGYSDIAIGTARLFGIRLMRNFAYPYFSQSVSEFWRRWHISLSTWFRDYVYIPLGGSRVGPLGRAINIMITFTASGFWHGAGWNYSIWGAMNGAGVVPSVIKSNRKKIPVSSVPGGDDNIPPLPVLLRMIATFLFLNLSFVIFCSPTMAEAGRAMWTIATGMFSPEGWRILYERFLNEESSTLLLTVLFIIIEWIQRRKECALDVPTWPRWLRWVLYSVLLYVVLYYGTETSGTFIYFQF